ncbi:MAG: hypothetical protein EOM16_06475, partial [Bacteroidia bacterium]|nr:hypothetical protein [Bacteroidia bacterium]
MPIIVMKKIKFIIPLLFVLLMGCNDWLSIDPKSEIDADVLFETPEGFSIALNGIYTNLSSTQMYGKEMKNTFLDVIARMYTLNHPTYEVIETYDYTNQEAKGIIERIWSVSYNSIANCNAILERVDQKESSFFPEAGKNMVKGEALSLRALLYFDLLRLFAPAPVVADQAAIPYYDKLSNKPMPYRKTSEILSLIIADLKQSKELQREFDTSEQAVADFKSTQRFSYSKGFFGSGRRVMRMGYYATTALLAQVALYAGDNALALENAMEFVDNPELIDFTSSDKIESNGYDRLLSEDIIFSLYNQEFEESFDEHNFLIANVDDIFGSDGDDFRRQCYLKNLGDQQQLAKFTLSEDMYREAQIPFTIPMFRLGMMYHIAIETMFDSDPQGALQLFTQMRTKRGCK